MALVEDLDHPIVFVFLVTLAVIAMAALITWGAKALHIPGLAALAQHP